MRDYNLIKPIENAYKVLRVIFVDALAPWLTLHYLSHPENWIIFMSCWDIFFWGWCGIGF